MISKFNYLNQRGIHKLRYISGIEEDTAKCFIGCLQINFIKRGQNLLYISLN